MRLFVALFPAEDARLDLRARLGRTTRTVPDERWHVTLNFLGEVPDDRLADVQRALDGVVPPGPIRLRLSGGGAFGRGRSTVLWAGVDGDLPALGRLHAMLQEAVPTDDRPFTPHLTVTYANDPAVRAALTDYAGPTWTATEFTLVHSRHGQGGGYQTVREWPLG